MKVRVISVEYKNSLHASSRADRLWRLTCDVVGDPAVSRLAALAQTTVPLMQQANVVVREAWPDVPGRNCDIQKKPPKKQWGRCSTGRELGKSLAEKPFYLAE